MGDEAVVDAYLALVRDGLRRQTPEWRRFERLGAKRCRNQIEVIPVREAERNEDDDCERRARAKRTPQPADLGFDPDALRNKYREEREKRLRPDGNDQYVEVTGEFAHFVDDPYVEPGYTREPLTDEVDVALIGGGFGGLLAGARLRQAGVEDIRIIEKGGDFGGTWYWNRYPGVACDIESYVYLPLLEELEYVPKEKYSRGGDLRPRQGDRREVRPLPQRLLPDRGDRDALGRETARRWIISTNRGDAMKARFVCLANGFLQKPKLPGIPGVETFKGHTFHTSRWDYAYTGGDSDGNLTGLAGQARGNHRHRRDGGAMRPSRRRERRAPLRLPAHAFVRRREGQPPDGSGMGQQPRARLAPEENGQLPDPHRRRLPGRRPGERRMDRHHPQAALRDAVGRERGSVSGRPGEEPGAGRLHEDGADPGAGGLHRRGPATAEALKPYYRQFCKRPCFHDEYLQTFNRPNVTSSIPGARGVERVTEKGVVVGGRSTSWIA